MQCERPQNPLKHRLMASHDYNLKSLSWPVAEKRLVKGVVVVVPVLVQVGEVCRVGKNITCALSGDSSLIKPLTTEQLDCDRNP